MFSLAGKAFPADTDELAISIRDALSKHLMLSGKQPVKADGDFPEIQKLQIDLSGAKVSSHEPPPRPKPSGKRQPGIRVGVLEVLGRPIHYEKSKLELTLKASGLELDFAKDTSGAPLLVLTAAEDGHVEAKIARADIEALLLAVARELAGQQKITVEELQLDLSSKGARSVAADARIKAKKMLVSGVIRIKGQLDIDDELTATISGLDASGEGMVGSLVSGVVDKKLQPYEGKKVPLMAFSLGDVKLRDLKISVTSSVEVSATFGKGK